MVVGDGLHRLDVRPVALGSVRQKRFPEHFIGNVVLRDPPAKTSGDLPDANLHELPPRRQIILPEPFGKGFRDRPEKRVPLAAQAVTPTPVDHPVEEVIVDFSLILLADGGILRSFLRPVVQQDYAVEEGHPGLPLVALRHGEKTAMLHRIHPAPAVESPCKATGPLLHPHLAVRQRSASPVDEAPMGISLAVSLDRRVRSCRPSHAKPRPPRSYVPQTSATPRRRVPLLPWDDRLGRPEQGSNPESG